MTHSYETWLICMIHDPFIRNMTRSYKTWLIRTRHDSFKWDMTHSYETWLVHVRHDAFMCMCWISHAKFSYESIKSRKTRDIGRGGVSIVTRRLIWKSFLGGLNCHKTPHMKVFLGRSQLSQDAGQLRPPKIGEIALWSNTRVVKCKYDVSQKQNGFDNKNQWYNIVLTFIFSFTCERCVTIERCL